MRYKYRYIICLILLILTLLLGYIVFAEKKAPEGNQDYISLNQCFTRQVNMPYYPYVYTLGALVDCLSFYESSNDPNAVGKAGEIGCLQFMPSTFQMYCVDKYGLIDDIWDCEVQMICSNMMLEDGLGYHWTTYNKCK